nr:hypothetical protein [Pseudomonas sp. s4]
MNDIDLYEWRAAKYGYEYKAGDDLDELDELLSACRTMIRDADQSNPDAEMEALNRLDAEREELDRWLNEQEERDLQSKLDDWDELATIDELTLAAKHDRELSGDFPQTEREAQQRRLFTSDQPDYLSSPINKAVTGKNARRMALPHSGDFPQEEPGKSAIKKRCTPRLAGLLAVLYHAHESNLAVLGELQTLKNSCRDSASPKIKDEISRRAAAMEFQQSLVQSITHGVGFPDWERRLSPDAKRAFALLALARHPDAKSFTFRLGHEVAEAAVRAKHGPTDYLARILQRLGLKQTVFVFERSASESDENNPYHIHGVAIIPADLLAELTQESIGANGKTTPSKLRAALAPPPRNASVPPIRGYRQRYDNKAIDIQPTRTASGWFQYITKEIDFTAQALGSRPDYASRSASKAGRLLYEAIRAWLAQKS